MRTATPVRVFEFAVALLLGSAETPLLAQPTGGQVVAGSATFTAGAGSLTIVQTSARAIINWQNFSLATGELAKFVQPDATSATLNRVVSGLPSSLAGKLEANGRIFLINSNGILIGAGARIDATGFLASTLDVTNNEFLAGGDLHFTGTSGAAIKNLGTINGLGGDVFLIARQVENAGAITAANGTAGLAAGSEVLLTTGGNERLFIQAASLPGAIVNSGTITAATAELKAAGGNAYALAINNSGVVRANGSARRDGQVWLVASGDGEVVSSGTVAATRANGTHGGGVQILGGKVTLGTGAIVDVSGAQGGGTALIGGDYQGRNPLVHNASATSVAQGATILADATIGGAGGNVIVWADDTTVFNGAISARGGPAGGAGGFAEVSGRQSLFFGGAVDLRAPAGQTGSLRLDPATLTLQSATPDLNGDGTTGDDVAGNIAAGSFPGASSVITSGQVATLLGTANLSLAATTAINVNATVNWNSAFGLTLDSGGTLNVNAAIANAGTGGIVLNAGSTLGLGASVSSAGAVTLNHAGALTQTAGTVTAGTLNLNGLGGVGAIGAPLAASAATIVLAKASGASATFVNDPSAVALSGATGGSLTFSADSGITINQNLTTAGPTTLNADQNNDGVGTLTVASGMSLATTGAVLNITAADITLSATNSLNSGAAATSITASAGRAIGLGGTAGGLTLANFELGRITAASLALNTTGATGDVTVDGIDFVGSLNTGPVTINAGGTATFAANASTFFKGITVNANNGIVVGADLTASNGNIVLDGDADSIASAGDGIAFTGARTLTAATDYSVTQDPAQGAITLRNGTSGAHGNITSAALDLHAQNGVTIADDLTATGGNFSVSINPDGQVPFFNGTFTVASGKTVATATSGDITIKASDIALDGSLHSVGAATLTASYNVFIGLGSSIEVGGLNLSDAELGRITATSLTINDDLRGLTQITMGGVTAANSSQFGTLTLTTNGTIHFENTSVVGNRFWANADGGIVFFDGSNLSTSTAVIANPDLTLTGNNLLFNTGITITAGGTGTLAVSPTDNFVTAGTLTLESGDNLVISRNLSIYSALTLNADKNNDGTGTLTIANGVTVATVGTFGPQPINITAADVVLTGTGALNSGTGATTLTATAGRPIGLGATVVAGGLNLSGGELQQITATGLTLTSTGNITVDGITEPNSNNIAGMTTLTANGGASTVAFANTASTFNALTVNATTTIAITPALTTDVGSLTLSSGTGTTQTGVITAGSLLLQGAGAVTLLNAGNNIGTLAANTTGSVAFTNGGALTIGSVDGTDGVTTGANAATIRTITGDLTLAQPVRVSGAAILTLASAANFINAAGASALSADTGRWLVWSADPASDTRGGLVYDFKQYNATFGSTTPAQPSGNGFLYTLAPAITPSLQGSVSRSYNGLTTATLGADNFSAAGAVDGDSVTLSGSGAFVTPNVGTSKTIDGSGIAIASAANDTASVYGYQLGATTASADIGTITAATLTYTANAATRLYGAGNPAFSGTVTGFVNGETQLGATTGTLAFGSPATSASNIGHYSILGSGLTANNGNYVFDQAAGNATALTINPASLTLSGTQVYNGTTAFAGSNLIATGVNGQTFAVTGAGASGNLSSKDVQTGQPLASVTGLGLGSSGNGGVADNYTSLAATGSSVSVTAATLILSGTRVFDGTTIIAGANLAATGVNGETFAVTGAGASGNLATKNVQTNQALASVTGLTVGGGNSGAAVSTNYATLATTGSSVSVTAKPLTLVGFASNDKTYDGTTAAVISAAGTLSGVVPGDTVSFSNTGATFDTKNTSVGTTVTLNGVTLTGSGDQMNYTFTATTTDASTITAATLTYTANAATRLYGAGNPVFSGTVTGFVNGETQLGATTGTLAFGSPATSASNVGHYSILGSGLTANNGNYVFDQAAGNATALTINAATLIYTATAASRFVGASNPAFSGTVGGFVNGDAQATATTGTLAFETTATNASAAGLYPLNGSGLTANNGNYLFTQAAANATSFTIGTPPPPPAPTTSLLTITADNKAQTYGAALPTFTASFAGFVNGDTASSVTGLQFTTTASIGSNVGLFTITPFGATAPASYVIGYVPGTLTINPATLIYTATPANRFVGASNPAFTGSLSGFVNGDTPTTATTGASSFGSAATVASVAGSYPINGSGLAANNGNYLFTQAPGNAFALTIGTPVLLTITADAKTKIYGAPLPTFTASFAGFVNGDAASSVTGLQFRTTATTGSNAGTYAITPFGATAPASYQIGYVAGTLTINPAALLLSANDATRVYGAANPIFGATFSGFVNGDTPSALGGFSFSTSATAASGVGNYAITPAGGGTANYVITYVSGALAVTPAPLTITAANASRDFGAANPTFSATLSGLVNSDTASVVSGLLVTSSATPASVAGNYVITPLGASAANYTIVLVNGTLQVMPSTVVVATTPTPVATINQQPVAAPGLAVIILGDRLVLVAVGPQGNVIDGTSDAHASLDDTLTFALGTAAHPPGLAAGANPAGTGGGATFPSEPNFGRFALVTSLGENGGASPPGPGGPPAAQLSEPGLFRESTVNMGGFKVIYHEALADARQQAENNTALGSSYHEFLDAENPRVDLVRATPSQPSGDEPASPGTGRKPNGTL